MRKKIAQKSIKAMLICLLVFIGIKQVHTQVNANYSWAKGYGSSGSDQNRGVVVDANGNVYTVGNYSSAISSLGLSFAGGISDVVITKHDATGVLQWAKGIGGLGDDQGFGIAIDAGNNICITGYFNGIVDFDPSADTANLTSFGSNQDIFIAKYDTYGNYVWAKALGGAFSKQANAITVDINNNIYVTGQFNGSVDFDPSANTASLTTAGIYDIFFAKYDANGNYIWAKKVGGTFIDVGYAIAVDASSNVYITGYFQLTVDFDPSSNTANLTSVNNSVDIFLAKYDATGNYLWAKDIGGTDEDVAYSIALDVNKNVYISGRFIGTADFDPSANTANFTSVASSDLFFAKYDVNGNYVWVNTMGGPIVDICYGITIDGNNNLYVTGQFRGAVDFNPSANTANLSSTGGSNDVFFAKYDSDGKYIWAKNIGGTGTDIGFSIAVDTSSKVYIAGSFTRTTDFDASSNTANIISVGDNDIFVTKYYQATIPCTSSTSTFTVSACDSYTWAAKGNKVYTASNNTDTIHLINAGGCDSLVTLNLTINQTAIPSISINSSANNICSGILVTLTATPTNGGTSPIYQWKKNGVNVGTSSTTYSSTSFANNDSVWCVLTSNSACATSPTAISNKVKMLVKTSPLVSPVKNNVSVDVTLLTMCTIGGQTTLYNSYLGGIWSSSNPAVATAVNGLAVGGASSSGLLTAVGNGTTTITYSLVSGSNGCSASASATVVVDAVPTLNTTTGGSSGVCINSSILLNNTSTIPAGGSGVWASTAGRATVNAVSGLVTGVNAGIASIKYTITNSNGCSNSTTNSVVVNSLPSVPSISYAAGTVNPQAGANGGAFCNNKTFTLVGNPVGGIWSTTNTTVVTVSNAGLAKTVGVGTGSVIYTYTNANGCSSSRSIVGTVATCLPRGINGGVASGEQLVASGEFTMYPNPAKTFISLSVNSFIGVGSIVVTDLYGKKVRTQSLSMGTNTVDVSSFAKGIYFVSTITKEGKTTKKLVVE